MSESSESTESSTHLFLRALKVRQIPFFPPRVPVDESTRDVLQSSAEGTSSTAQGLEDGSSLVLHSWPDCFNSLRDQSHPAGAAPGLLMQSHMLASKVERKD